jgi:linoleoyl-CoA desaturase
MLAGPLFLYVLAANAAANVIRNVWAYVIIFCGHFPDGVHYFSVGDVENETRARWYVRQLLGSCNIDGGPLFHVISGNLSHQIEHHLYPDMPSNRYPEVAPRVRALCARYGLPYNTNSLSRQFGTTMRKILRLSLPTAVPVEVVLPHLTQRSHGCQRVHIVPPSHDLSTLDRNDRDEAVVV